MNITGYGYNTSTSNTTYEEALKIGYRSVELQENIKRHQANINNANKKIEIHDKKIEIHDKKIEIRQKDRDA